MISFFNEKIRSMHVHVRDSAHKQEQVIVHFCREPSKKIALFIIPYLRSYLKE